MTQAYVISELLAWLTRTPALSFVLRNPLGTFRIAVLPHSLYNPLLYPGIIISKPEFFVFAAVMFRAQQNAFDDAVG